MFALNFSCKFNVALYFIWANTINVIKILFMNSKVAEADI